MALEEANLAPEKIKTVLLVGGSTKVEPIKNMIQAQLTNAGIRTVEKSEDILAYGAACRAAQIDGAKTRQIDRTSSTKIIVEQQIETI